MREVSASELVMSKLSELEFYLQTELKFSKPAARKRVARLDKFLSSLSGDADYSLCRLKQWRALGYRCAVFEGWVFAYETFDDGVIIQDMKHAKLITDVVH